MRSKYDPVPPNGPTGGRGRERVGSTHGVGHKESPELTPQNSRPFSLLVSIHTERKRVEWNYIHKVHLKSGCQRVTGRFFS